MARIQSQARQRILQVRHTGDLVALFSLPGNEVRYSGTVEEVFHALAAPVVVISPADRLRERLTNTG